MKEPPKGTMTSKYKPITCLPVMRKILNAQIKKRSITRLYVTYYFRKNRKYTSSKQEEQVINTSSRGPTKGEQNLAIKLIDYKTLYDMVMQTWIIVCRKIYKISDKIIKFFTEAIKTGKRNHQQRRTNYSGL